MARHFLGLYLLIVLTLAAVSWGEDWLLRTYERPVEADDRIADVATAVIANRLRDLPADQWARALVPPAGRGVDLEVFDTGEITGSAILQRLRAGHLAHMVTSDGDDWLLRQIDDRHVLALKSRPLNPGRGPLEWALTLLFYAAIALVLMIWIWPLTRDLRTLERATARYGDGNWSFDARIGPRSQVYPLAEAFRRMSARIDGLIASHKHMSSAVSHEIKTPLARMQFEIELAQRAPDLAAARQSMLNLRADIAEINGLVTATMEYAILERAAMQLQLAAHDFTTLLPVVVESVRRSLRQELRITVEVDSTATAIVCDGHLIEATIRNLLYNAGRHARTEIRVLFSADRRRNRLTVEDDGCGIAPPDRERVFESFVQLDQARGPRTGFGLGLAIVKRAIEWHAGTVAVDESALGGARFDAQWPASLEKPG